MMMRKCVNQLCCVCRLRFDPCALLQTNALARCNTREDVAVRGRSQVCKLFPATFPVRLLPAGSAC